MVLLIYHQVSKIRTLIKDVNVPLVVVTTRALIEFRHFQVLILTSSIGKNKTLYWQAFSYAGDSIHEAFFQRGSVALISTLWRMH